MSTSVAASASGWNRRLRSYGGTESNFAECLAAGRRAGRRNRLARAMARPRHFFSRPALVYGGEMAESRGRASVV
jgi:hypothetical protein